MLKSAALVQMAYLPVIRVYCC